MRRKLLPLAFVQGLGGAEIRPQVDSVALQPWWASVFTSTQNAVHGALFATFNTGGVANRAGFYFKDINGKVVDQRPSWEAPTTPIAPPMAIASSWSQPPLRRYLPG